MRIMKPHINFIGTGKVPIPNNEMIYIDSFHDSGFAANNEMRCMVAPIHFRIQNLFQDSLGREIPQMNYLSTNQNARCLPMRMPIFGRMFLFIQCKFALSNRARWPIGISRWFMFILSKL